MGSYASAINVRKSTLYEYSACSTFYDVDTRKAFPTLNWSHYRAALATKDIDMARIWLGKAADEEWSVEELREAIRLSTDQPPRAEKLISFPVEYENLMPHVNPTTGEITGYDLVFRIHLGLKPELDDALSLHSVYTAKIYSIPSESDDDVAS